MFKTLLTSFCCACVCLCQAQVAGFGELMDMQGTIANAGSTQLSQFTATIKPGSRVLLNWYSTDSLNDFFTIERSCNQKPFETVAVLKVPAGHALMDWQDEMPQAGRNVYRIKATLKNGETIFGGMTSVVMAGSIHFRFYPNPADNILILRSEYASDITVIDANGKTRVSLSGVSGLQLLNVATLEKGVYLLRVYNRVLNTLTQDRFVKN